MSRVTVSIFNSSDPDSIECMDFLGVVISSSEEVASGVTDRSGRFQLDLPPGKYFLNVIDRILSPSTGKGIPFLLDFPVTFEESKETLIKVEIDSSKVETEADIPSKLRVDVTVVARPIS